MADQLPLDPLLGQGGRGDRRLSEERQLARERGHQVAGQLGDPAAPKQCEPDWIEKQSGRQDVAAQPVEQRGCVEPWVAEPLSQWPEPGVLTAAVARLLGRPKRREETIRVLVDDFVRRAERARNVRRDANVVVGARWHRAHAQAGAESPESSQLKGIVAGIAAATQRHDCGRVDRALNRRAEQSHVGLGGGGARHSDRRDAVQRAGNLELTGPAQSSARWDRPDVLERRVLAEKVIEPEIDCDRGRIDLVRRAKREQLRDRWRDHEAAPGRVIVQRAHAVAASLDCGCAAVPAPACPADVGAGRSERERGDAVLQGHAALHYDAQVWGLRRRRGACHLEIDQSAG